MKSFFFKTPKMFIIYKNTKQSNLILYLACMSQYSFFNYLI